MGGFAVPMAAAYDPVKPAEKTSAQKPATAPKVTVKTTAKVAAPTATVQKTSAQKAPAQKPPAKKKKPAKKPVPKAPDVSQGVVDFIGWIVATGDNRELPFAVVDKSTAKVLVFNAEGKKLGETAALLGSAIGDESAEGVGDRELAEIPLDERTTPAGRFLAAFGPAYGKKSVLWVDYATSISIHPVLTTTAARREKRKERLASTGPEDNRITHGCINVAQTFYDKTVSPTFKNTGVFYVLPDTQSIETAFPAYQAIQATETTVASNSPDDAG
jgi:hypothetical protein